MSERRVPLGGRGVSQAIGFVLVFGIITSTVAVVYLAGFDSLDGTRQFERMNNAERAFDVLGNNVEDIVRHGAPSRATEIKLHDSELRAGDPVTVNVTVERSGDPTKNASYEYTVDPIIFQASDADAMVYSMGATFRESGSEAVMSREPTMVLNGSRIVVPIIQTRGSGGGVGGTTTALIRTQYSTSRVLVSNTSQPSDVYLNITTDRPDAWRDYVNDEYESGDPCTTVAPDRVECEFTTVERVYVTRIAVDFEFET